MFKEKYGFMYFFFLINLVWCIVFLIFVYELDIKEFEYCFIFIRILVSYLFIYIKFIFKNI